MAAATGKNGGRGPRSYLGQTGHSPYSINSFSSGTISTGYTFTGSYLSSISMEAAMVTPFAHPELTEEKKDHIISLVQKFFGARSTNWGDDISVSVLDKWFTELGVSWVLHVADDGTSAGIRKHSNAPSWIRALSEIIDTINLMADLFPQMEVRIPDQLQFTQFIEKTMFKMLAFVDVIAAPNAKTAPEEVIVMNWGRPQQHDELGNLLDVHDALSRALAMIRFPIHLQTCPKAEWIQCQIVSLLSTKEGKAGEAIWSKMEQIRTELIEEGDYGSLPRQGSSDIHKGTQSIMRYISFLRSHYSSVAPVVSEAASLGKYVPLIGDPFPLNSMIVEMVSCQEEKLVKISGSFPDQGLGFLFLLNNSYFIQETLQLFLLKNSSFIRGSPPKYSSLDTHVAALFEKVEGYIESYVQVSWAPVLSCLFNPTLLRFWKKYSPLCKFKSQFQKTYATQKLWKVPDPKLRQTLRAAITEKIIPDYTEYIEDNNVTTPELTPHELEEMLQELFEG